MYSAYKLNEQGDNIQPWCTPFPIWNQSVVSCPVLTSASWPAYTFLKRQVRWSGIPISLRIPHSLLWSATVKGFGIVNKAEVDVFLELSFFFHDTKDVGNLISGSSAFFKPDLNIWAPLRRSYHSGRCSSFQKNLTVHAESQGWVRAWPKVDRSLPLRRRAAFANKTFPTIIRRWFDMIWHSTK